MNKGIISLEGFKGRWFSNKLNKASINYSSHCGECLSPLIHPSIHPPLTRGRVAGAAYRMFLLDQICSMMLVRCYQVTSHRTENQIVNPCLLAFLIICWLRFIQTFCILVFRRSLRNRRDFTGQGEGIAVF